MNRQIEVKVSKFLVISGPLPGHVTQRMRNGHFRQYRPNGAYLNWSHRTLPNLSFISKFLELLVVCRQLTHCDNHQLQPNYTRPVCTIQQTHDGLVYGWIEAWLSDRWQRVCLDGVCSSWRRVWIGVPQGSVLGPILFLIFINDLDDQLSSNVLKFADDTKLFGVIDNHFHSQNLQKDIDTLCQWAQQ